MILDRVEKDDLVKAIYESSNIVASTYNRSAKNLNIVFKNGGSYTYLNVPPTDYLRFETAESQGKVLNGEIKKYQFLKHDNVNVDDVIKKIKLIKEEEIKSLEVGMLGLMRDTIETYDTTKSLHNTQFDKLSKMISLYREMLK
jgi:hypothetical protein